MLRLHRKVSLTFSGLYKDFKMFTDRRLIEKNTIGIVDLYCTIVTSITVNYHLPSIKVDLKIFVQLRPARFYDANEGRLDSTIPMLHNHVNLSLAAKECFHSDYQRTLRFDNNLFQNVV